MLNLTLPEGLEIHSAFLISLKEHSLNDFICRYEYEVTIDKESDKQINSFMSKQQCLVSREYGNNPSASPVRADRKPSPAGREKVGTRMIDIRPMVEKSEVEGSTLHLMLVDKDSVKVRLHEVLKEMLQRPIEEIQTAMIKRVRLYGYNSKGWIEPIGEKIKNEK